VHEHVIYNAKTILLLLLYLKFFHLWIFYNMFIIYYAIVIKRNELLRYVKNQNGYIGLLLFSLSACLLKINL